jgi:hypothetical protein
LGNDLREIPSVGTHLGESLPQLLALLELIQPAPARRSALTLDLRWGLLDMLHFPVATEVVSGGAAVRRVGLRYSAYRLFGTMQTFLQSLYRRRWSN